VSDKIIIFRTSYEGKNLVGWRSNHLFDMIFLALVKCLLTPMFNSALIYLTIKSSGVTYTSRPQFCMIFSFISENITGFLSISKLLTLFPFFWLLSLISS
jgi:hypothetical protein